MTNGPDPFTGTWKFRPDLSTLSSPPPLEWIQRIQASSSDVHVVEEIVGSDTERRTQTITAQFDGTAYPVSGSTLADSVAYRRIGTRTIAGVGRRNGSVTIRETLTAAADGGTITLSYTTFDGDAEVAVGVAVFERLSENAANLLDNVRPQSPD